MHRARYINDASGCQLILSSAVMARRLLLRTVHSFRLLTGLSAEGGRKKQQFLKLNILLSSSETTKALPPPRMKNTDL